MPAPDPRLRVSVILPTFNRAGYIGAAIASLLRQTRRPDEILIVDDGSTDGTAEVVAGFGEEVGYIRQANAGKLAAISTGLDLVGGDLVWIMDDDDIAPEGALAALAQPFERDPGIAISYGRMVKFTGGDGSMVFGAASDYPTGDPRPFLVKLLEDCFITGHPCVLVRRADLEALRPFDRSVTASVDYYLHLGVARRGAAAFIDEVVLWQRQHGGLRGPAAERYAEADRNDRWRRMDRRLIGEVLPAMELGEFIGVTGRPLSPAEQRRALIQRAVIGGRKELWEAAFADLAAVAHDRRPLDAREVAILGRLLGSRYGPRDAYADPAILRELRARVLGLPGGRQLLAEVGRPLLHQVKVALRSRDMTRLREASGAWLRLMDVPSAALAARDSAARNGARLLGALLRRPGRPAADRMPLD